MERLTFKGTFCEIAQCLKTPGGSFCESGACSQRKVWERLKAYEDTGLTPSEALSMQMDMAIINAMFQHAEVERMKELTAADKDRRLVALPCKVGDTVFLLDRNMGCVHECEAEFVNIGTCEKVVIFRSRTDGAQYGADFLQFGKAVFFTREEAEAALKELAHE